MLFFAEHFVSNLLPAGMGPVLCGSHMVATWTWYTLVITVTLNSHCGYHFPFLPSPEAHDFHHLRFNQVRPFEWLLLMKMIHGTLFYLTWLFTMFIYSEYEQVYGIRIIVYHILVTGC